MSQVPLVRTKELCRGMAVESPLDGWVLGVFHFQPSEQPDRFDIQFIDGTVINNSHSLTLWRLR